MTLRKDLAHQTIKLKRLSQRTFVSLEDVLKTSSRHFLKTSSTRLQSVTSFGLPSLLKTSCKDVMKTSHKTSSKRLGRRITVTLKTSSRHVFKTCIEHVFKTCLQDFRNACLQDVLETKIWGYLYLTKINGYASNKSIFHKSISDDSTAHPKSLIRTQWLQYSSYFEIQAAFLFSELKFLMTVWCCKITWIQIRHCRTGEDIKTKF